MTETYEPIGPICATMGPPAVIYYDWIYPIMYLFGAVLMIPLIYMYLKSYIISKLKVSKLIFSIILVYFIIQFMTYVLTAIWARYECHSLRISKPINIASMTLLSIQTLMLLGLLFYKLYKTYHIVPSLALSKLAIITFSIFYIVTCIMLLTAMTMHTLAPAGITGVLLAMTCVCIVILSILLFGVYIHKLHLIAAVSKDEELLNLIAKNSLLGIVSISVTLFGGIIFILVETFLSPYYDIVVAIFIILDIYTNALCVFLSYKAFEAYYYKICGCCDSKCIRKCLTNKDLDLKATTAQTETATV